MWLYVPKSVRFPSSLESQGSIWDWGWDSIVKDVHIALWCTSSGKPTQRPFSWRGWQTRLWHQLLFGTVYPASMADHGVAVYMGLSAASPARTSAWLEKVRASHQEHAPGSGPSTSASSTRSVQRSSSSKTSPHSSVEVSIASSETLPRSGTMRRGMCSPQKESGLRTAANDSSSSRGWPTTTTTDAKASGAAGYSTASGRHSGTTLTDAAVRNWPTTTTRDWKDTGFGKVGKNQLAEAVFYPTPSSSSYGSNQGGAAGRVGEKRHSLQALARQGSLISSLPDEKTLPGETSSRATRRLNPLFTEWLMGWPRGWTNCGPLATGSFRSWQELHGAALARVLGRP